MYCKQGQLARERQALLSKFASSNLEQMDDPTERCAEMTRWSDQLRTNASAEYKVNLEFSSAYWAGVSSVPILVHLLHIPDVAGCCIFSTFFML